MDAAIDQWPEWWRAGDAEAFAGAYLERPGRRTRSGLAWEYHTALVTERNARMARRLADWLEGEETCFVTLAFCIWCLRGTASSAVLRRWDTP